MDLGKIRRNAFQARRALALQREAIAAYDDLEDYAPEDPEQYVDDWCDACDLPGCMCTCPANDETDDHGEDP